jgi:hypothetical protein
MAAKSILEARAPGVKSVGELEGELLAPDLPVALYLNFSLTDC